MATKTIERDGHEVRLSNLDKVFFPGADITKGDVVDYYDRVAETMIPHVRGRFISMHRWPDGIEGEDFYQKEAPGYFPSWIRTGIVPKEEGSNRQVIVDDRATLVYLADQACLTPHVWLSRADRIRKPDRLVFDFDPTGDWEEAFDGVRWAARRLRAFLEDLGVQAWVMTSGSRGLHVSTALEPTLDFDSVKPFARDVATVLAERYPDRLTVEVRKAKREGRIFIDYLRNEYAQTAVPPYAVRARPGAPVATPLEWDELSRSGLDPRRYTLRNLFRRLGQRADPWVGIDRAATSLDEGRRRLDDLMEREDA